MYTADSVERAPSLLIPNLVSRHLVQATRFGRKSDGLCLVKRCVLGLVMLTLLVGPSVTEAATDDATTSTPAQPIKTPGELDKPTVPDAPKPVRQFVPLTLEQRIATAFNVKGTPSERYTRARELTHLINQNLLVVFGVPEDPRIQSLMKIRYVDQDYRQYSDDYLVMLIPTDEKRREDADKLAASLEESLDGDRSAFLLVLVDSKGDKVDTVTADQLNLDGELSRDKFFDWLSRFRTEPKDAKKLLADALVEARQQKKRVLIQESATWCGPCHMLSRFLKANPVWEKDYILVKMDYRYKGVQEVMSELRENVQYGIPWIAILDADGTKLATSTEPKTKQNIGFPTNAPEIAHFEQMLKATRQKLTDDEIAGLIQALNTETK